MKTLTYVIFVISISSLSAQEISFELIPGTPFLEVTDGDAEFNDVDGDGDMDVIITGYAGSPDFRTAVLYLNTGGGEFVEAVTQPFSGVDNSSVEFLDVDMDGVDDLIISGRINGGAYTVKLYINDGAGEFLESIVPEFIGVTFSASSVADVDGDGDKDILITGENTALIRTSTLYFSDGAGGFSVSPSEFIGVERGSVSFGDIDGDGDEDVVITGVTNATEITTTFYLNNSLGEFALAEDIVLVPVEISDTEFADVDGDGDLDLLMSGQGNSSTGITRLYANNGTGGFTNVPGMDFPQVQHSSIAFVDLDLDGDLDLILAGDEGFDSISVVYENDGEGNFTLIEDTPLYWFDHGDIAIGDIDGDARPDVLLTGAGWNGGRIANLYGNTTPVFPDGITEYEQRISISPNPSSGTFFLDGIELDETITISVKDILGSDVPFEFLRSGSQVRIDLNAEAGLYFLVLSDRSSIVIQKL